MSTVVIQQSRENPRALELLGRSQRFLLEAASLEQLRALTAQYRHCIGNRYGSGLHEQLLQLGQALHTWLRDCGNWQQWLVDQDQPATLEWRLRSLQVPAGQHGGHEAAEIAATLCNTPWEILADTQGFLAKRSASPFVVLRRFPNTAKLPEPSAYRLSVLFMAASPYEQPELDYRAEEVAIEQAAGRIGVDLTVEESGELGQLGETFAQTCATLGAVDVLHLSCHGHNQPQPMLVLENEHGNADPVTASRLWEHVGERALRLGFVSACHTAEGSENDPSAHYAAQLVAHGLPAAVAWGGAVLDQQAIVFAEALYGYLSRGVSLEVAYRIARNRLADDGDSRDWHLPRLLLATGAEGALCSGSGRSRRSINPRAFADAAFLGGNRLVPIATFHEFVGRRRNLQKAMTALRHGQGVLLHGPGNLGKSSLAGRLARRFAEHHHVVVHCSTFTATQVVQAIEEAYRHQEVTAVARQTCDVIASRSDNLRDGLARLLSVAEEVARPLLLVIDDFEHLLDEPTGTQGLHTVVPSYDASVRQILAVFAAHGGASRLVITCRYDFTLSGVSRDDTTVLQRIQLEPFSDDDHRRQLGRLLQIAGGEERLSAAQHETMRRAMRLASGNPGLLRKLADYVRTDADAAPGLLDEVQAYLAEGRQPTDSQVSDYLQSLAITRMLDRLSPVENTLLGLSKSLLLPVPVSVMHALAKEVLGSSDGRAPCQRLLSFGLWDAHADLCEPQAPACALNALVRPRVAELVEADTQTLWQAAVPLLQQAWPVQHCPSICSGH